MLFARGNLAPYFVVVCKVWGGGGGVVSKECVYVTCYSDGVIVGSHVYGEVMGLFKLSG